MKNVIVTPEYVVDQQLMAYNNSDYENFAAYYKQDIVSYDLHTCKLNPKMCGESFFAYYRHKFLENPNLHCLVTKRISQGNLVIDEEIISEYRKQKHKEVVIYQVDDGLISKMWFSKEIPFDGTP